MEYFEMNNNIVYVQTDTKGTVIDINSSAFLGNLDGWIRIDEGIGDKYHHAHGNYLKYGLIDENGLYNYKLVDGVITERTATEKQADLDSLPPAPKTLQEEIEELKQLVADLASLQLGV